MKTLKKSLALVLAVVMALSVLGVLAVPASAYTDDDDIVNVEAVDVLSGIGAIEGVDGAFLPGKTLTRAEAAGIIARILLGRSVADTLPKSGGKFTDVAADHWAGGYINYCVSMNIINGATATTFNPSGEITDVGFLKLLLGALGYNDNGELTGPMWMVNTLAKAIPMGLTEGETADVYDEPACRDCMAQYAFNALKYSPTATTKTVTKYALIPLGSYDTTRDTSYTDSPFATYQDALNAAAADGTADGTNVFGTNFTITPVTVEVDVLAGSIAKNVYSMEPSTADDAFGRPGVRTWVYKNEIISKAYTQEPVMIYTAAVSEAKLYTDLSLVTIASPSANITTYTNGTKAASVSINGNTRTDFGSTDNGVLTEVYRTSNKGDTNNLRVVMIDTYVGEITAVTPATATAKETVTVTVGANNPGGTLTSTGTFAAEGFEVGDIVLYTATDNIRSVELAEVKNLTASSWASTSFVAGGVAYKYSKNAETLVSDFNANDVYFDNYGYVIDVDAPPPATNYAYVVKTANTAGEWGTVAKADLILSSGERVTVETVLSTSDNTSTLYEKTGSGAFVEDTGASTSLDVKRIVTYQVNSKGQYVLSAAGTPEDQGTTGTALSVVTGKSAITWGSNTYYGNAKTVYIVRSGATYNVYTGFANVPGMSGNTVKGLVLSSTGATGGVATVVYVENPLAGTSTTSVFVPVQPTAITNTPAGQDNYYLLDVVVNGAIQELKLASNYTAGIYTAMSTNSQGVTTLDGALTAATYGQTDKVLRYSSSVITLNTSAGAAVVSIAPASDINVYTYNETTGALTKGSLASIPTGVGTLKTYWYQTNAGGSQITNLFISSAANIYTIAQTGFVDNVTGLTVTGATTSPTDAAAGATVTLTITGTTSFTSTNTGTLTTILTLSNGATMAGPTITVTGTTTPTIPTGTFVMPAFPITSITVNGTVTGT